MQDYEQQAFVDDLNDKFTSKSNMISYEQYLKENESQVVHNTPSPANQDSMIMYVIEQMSNQVAICNAEYKENQLNQLPEDFGKCFVPPKELSAEQAFWLPLSNPNSEQTNVTQTPVRVEVHKELPKVFSEEVIPFKNSLQTLVKDFENGLLIKLNKVKTMFNQMEAAVDQCSVDKKLFEIEKKELKLENERLLKHIICQDVVNTVMHADVKFDNVLPVPNTFLDDNIALDMMKMENG
ncbi:hypothetical protein Tco_0217194 [Tanacetum coccineum]